MTTLVVIICIYLFVVILGYAFQKKLIYQPCSIGRSEAAHYGLVPWPDGEDFHGYISGIILEEPRGTILIWHGNGGCALHRGYYVHALEKRGFRVILLEYPGYGDRKGDLSEESFIADAAAAVRKVYNQFSGPYILWGESMGCGVASKIAALHQERIQGLVMLTPWANLPDLVQAKTRFLPAKLLVRDTFDNVGSVAAYQGRVAVVMAGRDNVVPNKHTRKLYSAIPSPKRLWIFENAGHNSWPADASELWWDEVIDFIGQTG